LVVEDEARPARSVQVVAELLLSHGPASNDQRGELHDRVVNRDAPVVELEAELVSVGQPLLPGDERGRRSDHHAGRGQNGLGGRTSNIWAENNPFFADEKKRTGLPGLHPV
jgi:hypothetical protein